MMVPRGLVPWRVCHHCNPQTTVPPPEVVLVCLQPEREPDRGRGNRAPPLCQGNGAWPQLQDDHLPTMRRCLIHERHLSMLTAQAREAAIVTITRAPGNDRIQKRTGDTLSVANPTRLYKDVTSSLQDATSSLKRRTRECSFYGKKAL